MSMIADFPFLATPVNTFSPDRRNSIARLSPRSLYTTTERNVKLIPESPILRVSRQDRRNPRTTGQPSARTEPYSELPALLLRVPTR